jgi:hypothetical protein
MKGGRLFLVEKSLELRYRPEFNGILQMIWREMRIAHGHSQRGVTEDFLQGDDVSTIYYEPAGKRMP